MIIQYTTTDLGVTVIEFAFFRSICNALGTYIILIYEGSHTLAEVSSDMMLPLSLRCILGNSGFLALAYSFKYLPLAIATTIISSSPFAVSVLCSLFLSDRFIRSDFVAIFISFFGIIVMAFAKQGESNSQALSTGQYITAIAMGCFSMLIIAVVQVASRYMKITELCSD